MGGAGAEADENCPASRDAHQRGPYLRHDEAAVGERAGRGPPCPPRPDRRSPCAGTPRRSRPLPPKTWSSNLSEPPVDLGGVTQGSGMALSISIAPSPSRPGSRRSRTMPGEKSERKKSHVVIPGALDLSGVASVSRGSGRRSRPPRRLRGERRSEVERQRGGGDLPSEESGGERYTRSEPIVVGVRRGKSVPLSVGLSDKRGVGRACTCWPRPTLDDGGRSAEETAVSEDGDCWVSTVTSTSEPQATARTCRSRAIRRATWGSCVARPVRLNPVEGPRGGRSQRPSMLPTRSTHDAAGSRTARASTFAQRGSSKWPRPSVWTVTLKTTSREKRTSMTKSLF